MPTRPKLDDRLIAPAALADMEAFHSEILLEVQAAVGRDAVVVVGMARNAHVKSVRQALTAAGVQFRYLEFGGYLSRWRERLAIKLWSGWPTFPQVFVRGVLVGGEDRTKAALADGSLKALLAAPSVPARASSGNSI